MRMKIACTWLVCFAASITEASEELVRIGFNNPGLVVDLGVGLWAWPLPMDYDGDGDHDIMWRRPYGYWEDGTLQVWLMDGAVVSDSFDLQYPALGWKPWKIADLNGDRKKDLVWWDRPPSPPCCSW